MIELIEATNSRAVRNKNNVLALYDLMINQKRSEEATAKFVSPSYIQHNPLIPNGSVALGQFFAKVTRERALARVVVHRIIAVGDYVWAHLNFLNRSTMIPTTPALLASISIAWTLRGKPSSTGIRCNSWARLKTPLRSSRRTFRVRMPTACSDRKAGNA